MELIDLVFNFVSDWIMANKTQSIGVGSGLLVLLILINPKVAKQAGRAFSDLLKRIPLIGVPLEKKIEVTQEAFNQGMKEDDANLNSTNLPNLVNNSQNMSDNDVNSNECPSNPNESNAPKE